MFEVDVKKCDRGEGAGDAGGGAGPTRVWGSDIEFLIISVLLLLQLILMFNTFFNISL